MLMCTKLTSYVFAPTCKDKAAELLYHILRGLNCHTSDVQRTAAVAFYLFSLSSFAYRRGSERAKFSFFRTTATVGVERLTGDIGFRGLRKGLGLALKLADDSETLVYTLVLLTCLANKVQGANPTESNGQSFTKGFTTTVENLSSIIHFSQQMAQETDIDVRFSVGSIYSSN